MSFFKDFKEDLLQAADELISSDEKDNAESMEALEVENEEAIDAAVEESTSDLNEVS